MPPSSALPSDPSQWGLGGDPGSALQHMKYECPVRTWLVQPIKVRELFSRAAYVRIPIFQRRYCWEEIQVTRWWRDILDARGDNIIGHRLGKTYFTPCGSDDAVPELLCIDGQQRITTTFLFLASLRGALLGIMRRALSAGADRSVQLEIARVLQSIDAVLFRDGDQCDIAGEAKLFLERNQKPGVHHVAPPFPWPSVAWPEGMVFPPCRLTPSYQDRALFYALVTEAPGTTHSVPTEPDAAQPAGTPQPRPVSYSDMPALLRTKRMFDAYMHEHLSATTDDAVASVKACAHLLRRALDFFSIMYLECPREAGLQQLFLWLQEKSLFSVGALLFNPSPGVKFCMSDLVRNLLLSYFASRARAEQEAFYMVHWVPLESCFETAELFDGFLAGYVARAIATANESGHDVPISEFESTVAIMETMFTKALGPRGEDVDEEEHDGGEEDVPEPSAPTHRPSSDEEMPVSRTVRSQPPNGVHEGGATGYARFISYFEWRLAQHTGEHPELVTVLLTELRAAAEAH